MSALVVFGANGQVGRELARTSLPSGWRFAGLDRRQADVTQTAAVETALSGIADAAAVVNVAAYTAVDAAEAEPDLAFAVNAQAPGILARAAARRGLPLLHLSTDYVFDGSPRRTGWREDDPIAPLNVYGRSKAAGEAAALAAGGRVTVLRTSWLFGPFGHNFVRTVLRLARERPVLEVVDDQIGRPTAAASIAAAIVTIATRQAANARYPAGLFHVADAGETTWHGFARAILDGLAARGGPQPRLEPITTGAAKRPARRPANSVLATEALAAAHGIAAVPWQVGLARCLDELVGSTSSDVRTSGTP